MQCIPGTIKMSRHIVQVYATFTSQPAAWMSNHEVASKVASLSARTVRAHTAGLVRLGLVEQAEVFPGHRYRLAERRPAELHERFAKAAEVHGIDVVVSVGFGRVDGGVVSVSIDGPLRTYGERKVTILPS